MIKLSVTCLVLLFTGYVIADHFPVLIWGPFNYDAQAIAPALKSFNEDEFNDILHQHITSDTFILVASEDQLSTEDLSQCKTENGYTCFQGIQQIKNKLYLTSVQDPIHVINDMAACSYKTDITISPNGDLSEPLNAEGGKYVSINFDDNARNETKSTKLARHDKIILNLYDQLSSQDLSLMVIYTGKSSEHQKRIARQVQEATPSSDIPDEPTQLSHTLLRSDQVLLYYTRLSKQNASLEESIYFKYMNVVEVDTRKLQVSLLFESNSSLDASLEFIVIGKGGNWYVNNFTWGHVSLASDTHIYAGDKFSYHCSLPIKLSSHGRDVVLKFYGLQLQVQFTTVSTLNRFGDAYDCIGFVSPGILNGLFVTFLLAFVLFVGISCIMDIKTMDRFDDPKGKTITVTNDHD